MSMNFSIKRTTYAKKIFGYSIFFLPIVFFIFHFGEIPFPRGSEFTDLLISHYPNLNLLRRTLLENHVIPLWNPQILSGSPFIENPLSGFWYLPGWLALIWDSPVGIFLLEIIHLVWGGLGMYRFLRSEGCGEGASLLGGLFFELMPKMITHMAVGHVSLIYAIAWTPWLLLAEKRSDKNAESLLPGLIWAVIIFADIRWAAYAFILWFVFGLNNIFFHPDVFKRQNLHKLIQIVRKWIIQTVFAVGVSAPFLLPFSKFVGLSTRNTLAVEDAMELSLPIKYLMSILFPDFGGYAEWITYFGGLAVIVMLFSLGTKEFRRKNAFWLIVFGFCLFLSLGSVIPGLDYLFSIPGLRLLRVPTRFLFLSGFAISVLSARLMDTLITDKLSGATNHFSKSIMGMVMLVAFEIMFTVGVVFISHSYPIEFIWGTTILTLYSFLIIVWLKTQFREKYFLFCLLFLSIIDLCVVGISQFDFEKWDDRISQYTEMLEFLNNDTEIYRIYSPSYSVPQDIASYGQLELADGVDPLQLKNYSEFMKQATGVHSDKYSVTLPAYENGEIKSDNMDAIPDLLLLGRMNVKYLVSEFEINESRLELVKRINHTYLYRNPEFRRRVWIEKDNQKDFGASRIQGYSIHPNNVQIQTAGSGTVVLSEVNYPNWSVYIDGVKMKKNRNGDLLRVIDLNEGAHTVEWKFFPQELYAGIGIALLTCLTALFVRKKKNLGV